MNQTEAINRRQFDRYSFQDNFVVDTENFQGISTASSKNLSRKGAQLFSEKPLTVGSIVSIEIPSKKLQLMAEIRWVRPQTDGKGFEVGISFHELFPSTGSKIANLIQEIQEIQIKSEDGLEGTVFSFELEANVSKFLDTYIDAIRPEAIMMAPISYRRLGTPTENSYSFFTPSRPNISEATTHSFRIDDPHAVKSFPVRAILLGMLAISLLIFRDVFISAATHWFSPKTATVISKPAVEAAVPSVTTTINNTATALFYRGPIDKIEWSGEADMIDLKITFRDEMTPAQVQVSKINFEDHPRALIKVMNQEEPIDPKSVLINHPLINQIRLGFHDEINGKNLHMVMDLTSSNVVVFSSNLTGKILNVRLKYTNIRQ